MKRFLTVLLLLVIVVAGLGFYLGWWRVSSSSADNTVDISLTVDKDKIQEDAQTVQDLGRQDEPETVSTTGESRQ